MALVYSLVDIHCSEKGPYFRDQVPILYGPFWLSGYLLSPYLYFRVPIFSVFAKFTQRMSNQSSCTQHDEQIPALLLSVAKVCITCWQLHFKFYLCLRVRFHKLSFWVPILAAEGPYFIKCWVPISSQVGSLFLSLEVPKSFRNSGYLQEINLITAATTIKNSDLQKQEFQQLAKTKEIRNGDPVMHAFWALYSPLALCSIYPRHNPLFPICLQYNLCAKKWRPSCFHTYLPPSAVM